MTYLVTGNRGFIGRHLMQYLAARGFDPIGFDMLGDYPTVEVLEEFMKINRVERVFHLGARAFIPDCYGNEILSVLNSNTVFTANLLVACRNLGIGKLLYFSTSEVYGTPMYVPIDEKHRVQPQSTYAATKLAAENLCRTFSKETGLDVVIQRQFNVFGPLDKHPRVIPKMIDSVLNNKTIEMGNPNIKRDFTYVGDACDAAINIMESDTEPGDIYNFGSGNSISLRTLYESIQTIVGCDSVIKWNSPSLIRPWDVPELKCDKTKYEKKFPWHATTDFYEGLIYTVDWFKEKKVNLSE